MKNIVSKIDLISDVRESADIVQVISNYIKLQKKGSSFFGLCPFHNDQHPSLSVSPKKKIWKCFVCGAKGDVFSFVSKKEGINYLEAVVKVAKLIGYNNINQLEILDNKSYKQNLSDHQKRLILANERANEFFTGVLYNDENKNIREYLYKRNLTDEIIKKFGIGYAIDNDHLLIDWLTNKDECFGSSLSKDKYFNTQELFDAGLISENNKSGFIPFLINRITFPIYNENNQLVAFSGRDWTNKGKSKYSNTRETEIFNKGNILYNLNNIKKINNLKELIIVEGFMDCIAYYKAGYENCVATMGTAMTEKTLVLLYSLGELDDIILSFDNDLAGQQACASIGGLLFENGFNVSIIDYASFKEKDVDEIIQNHNNIAIKQLIENRIDYILFIIRFYLKNKVYGNSKINIVKNLIKYIVQHSNNQLQKTKYLKEIANLTGFEFTDINDEYENEYKRIFNNQQFPQKKRVVRNVHEDNFYKNLELIKNEIINDDQVNNINIKLTKTKHQYIQLAQEALIQILNVPSTYNLFINEVSFRFIPHKSLGIIFKILEKIFLNDNEFTKDQLNYEINQIFMNQINKNSDYDEAYKYYKQLNVEFEQNILNDSYIDPNKIKQRIHDILKKLKTIKHEYNRLLNVIDLLTKQKNGQIINDQDINKLSDNDSQYNQWNKEQKH